MKNAMVLAAVMSASMLLAANSAKATLIYGFEAGDAAGPEDGFVSNGQTALSPSAVGVTQGLTSLEVLSPGTVGYTSGSIDTTYVPTALINASSVSYDLTLQGTLLGYGNIYPVFYLETTTMKEFKLVPDLTLAGNDVDISAQNFTDSTQTFNLASYTDPDAAEDGDTGEYTVGQIIQNDAPYDTESVGALQLKLIHGSSSAGTDIPFYFDNFTVPSPAAAVPEPASLSVLAFGGLLLGRRRRAR